MGPICEQLSGLGAWRFSEKTSKPDAVKTYPLVQGISKPKMGVCLSGLVIDARTANAMLTGRCWNRIAASVVRGSEL